MKYKTLMILIIVMMPFLRVPSEASAETPIFSHSEIAHAKAVHAQHLGELMSLPGVHGVGIGEKSGHIGILILVDNESRTSHMPKTVEDMPAIVRAVGEITAHQINLGVDGGNNIVCNGYCASGTVGFKVCDNTASGIGGFITNNHVAATGCPGLCPNKAPLGTNFLSPSFCDGGTTNVGTLNRFITIVLDDVTHNFVDAAFVQSTDAQVSNYIQEIGPQNNTVANAYLNQAVCKSGRTSGLTCGTVTGINLTISVSYSDVGRCGIAIFSNQIMYSPTSPYTVMSQSGDSGSPVVEANTNAAVALNFAGDTSGDGFGNPIGPVLSALQVSLCGSISDVPDTTPPTTTASPAGGTYNSSQSVTLTCNDTGGSGCQTTYYCLGSGCNPTTVYSGSINISSSTSLRFYSTDNANNSESVKTETYTINTPDISVSPTSLNFGQVVIGNSSTKTVTISNTGTANLVISSIEVTGTDAGMFSVVTGGTNPCPSLTPTITPGSNCTVNVTFSPTSTLKKTATLSISSNDPDENPVNVSLSGNGVIVKLTKPNGGQIWKSGTIQKITWQTTSVPPKPVAQFRLSRTLDGGTTWKTIVTHLGSTGSYNWTVPAVASIKKNCKVKVILLDSLGSIIASDVSDKVFTIKP